MLSTAWVLNQGVPTLLIERHLLIKSVCATSKLMYGNKCNSLRLEINNKIVQKNKCHHYFCQKEIQIISTQNLWDECQDKARICRLHYHQLWSFYLFCTIIHQELNNHNFVDPIYWADIENLATWQSTNEPSIRIKLYMCLHRRPLITQIPYYTALNESQLHNNIWVSRQEFTYYIIVQSRQQISLDTET